MSNDVVVVQAEHVPERRPANFPVTLHWIYLDPAGPIISGGISGVWKGARYRIACQPFRKQLPCPTANFPAHKALECKKCLRATAEPAAVNCEACRKHPDFPAERKPPKAVLDSKTLGLLDKLFQPPPGQKKA